MTRDERLASRRRIRTRGEAPKAEDRVFREGLGFSMTNTNFSNFSKNEADYNKQYAELASQIEEANKSLSAAEKKIGGINIDTEYGKAKDGWIKVNVMNGMDKEGTYFMPRDMVDALNTDSFNGDEGTFTGSWGLGEDKGTDPEQYYVDVRPRGSKNPMGKELHENMQEAEKQLKTEFYKKVSPELDDSVAEATATLRQERDIVQGEYDLLTSSKEQRDTMKSDAKSDYETKRKSRGTALVGAIQ